VFFAIFFAKNGIIFRGAKCGEKWHYFPRSVCNLVVEATFDGILRNLDEISRKIRETIQPKWD